MGVGLQSGKLWDKVGDTEMEPGWQGSSHPATQVLSFIARANFGPLNRNP
jgi:hypothetical protein